jgi:hypothetical protein
MPRIYRNAFTGACGTGRSCVVGAVEQHLSRIVRLSRLASRFGVSAASGPILAALDGTTRNAVNKTYGTLVLGYKTYGTLLIRHTRMEPSAATIVVAPNSAG